MPTLVKNFFEDESGPTMVEYGLLVALIALVVGIAAVTLGQDLSDLFSKVAAYVSATPVSTAP